MIAPRPLLLLVEDSAPVLHVLRDSLDGAGFEVDTARTVAEAMERLVERRYAADCALPDLKPMDWLAALRGAAPFTPLVVARAWGVVAVLEKPFSPAHLVVAVRRAVTQQPNGEQD